MERADQADASPNEKSKSTRVYPKSSQHERPRTALILYGSETGNAQDVAEEVGRMADRLRFDTTVVDMDSVQVKEILKPTVVIFAISTTGQGEMPQNARKFWKTLLSGALKPGVLRRVRFTSFGLGDSSYARYNVSHRMVCGRMMQLGAQAFCERGEGNEQHPEGHSAGLREWIVTLKQKLLDTFPPPDGVETLQDDVFLEPKWKLDLADRERADQLLAVNGLADSVYHSKSQGEASAEQTNGDVTIVGQDSVDKALDDVPGTTLLPIKDAYVAYIAANDRVTAPDHFQDVRLVDLRIEGRIQYGPGAVAVVYPKNFQQDVQDFINLMDWKDIADKQLTLVPTASAQKNTPSPLRHLNLPETDFTVRWLLENVLDIMSIPRRSFFASLAYFAGEDTEDEAYQKERLLELANPELIDELWDYTTRPKRTISEVMMDFTTIKIPWQYALMVLPLMKGRQFSIASGGHLRQDDEGRTRVQLLVAIADPPSPIIKWRRRYGVCTRYVATLRAGQSINVGMQEGYLDVQPHELEVPVVMIGPGTGLAPMRSMIWQRLLWARDRERDQRLKGDILIFGCRNQSGDYFFREEWERLQQQQGLSVLTAFSRDKHNPKQYVQNLIRSNGAAVRKAIVESSGKIYVCGSSGNMPKGVREALLDVMSEGDASINREEAEGYLERMEKDGRYKQETW